MSEVRIGTRASALALTQARQVKRMLEKRNPGVRFRLVTMKTFGDEFQGVEIFRKTNVGVFTKTIEKKLLSGGIDLAVHSLKDLPTALPGGLIVGAVPQRFPAQDVLLSRDRDRLIDLPWGATVGTGSPRRKRQLLLRRPDLKVVDLRGNLETRVAKVIQKKELDAVVIAHAGLLRMKKCLKFARVLSPKEMLPAVGQGALAIELRASDKAARRMVRKIHHDRTDKEVTAERIFLGALQGGCRVPVGAYARINKGTIFLKGAVFSVKTMDYVEDEIKAPVKKFKLIGRQLAARLVKKGARRFLSEARRAESGA